MNAPDRAAWLAQRKTGIGGSDIAAILGVSPYKTAVDVFLDKTGQAEDQDPGEPAYWGTVLEDVVAQEYSKRNCIKVERVNRVLRHPQHDWMLANLDRICWQDGKMPVVRQTGEIRSKHLLECKTASVWKARAWEQAENLSDDPLPVEYTAQVMWYMAITGADICDVAVLIGGQRYEQRRVERDDETIRGMIERAEAFWHGNVLAGVAPPASNAADALALFPADNGDAIDADEPLVMAIDRIRYLAGEIKPLEDEADALKDYIKTRLGEAAAVSMAGQVLATWKKANDSKKTDWKQAAADLKAWAVASGIPGAPSAVAAIIEGNTTMQAGSRRLLIK